ncbi:hypothetical protein LCGC14_0551900 [marine sediment metagenome]|uniref:Bbp19-like phage domain-containing protein n=1 Tax=marine sediment metagenome TaxID=412755 RepID=A0A0F9UXX2_9ZZZZ
MPKKQTDMGDEGQVQGRRDKTRIAKEQEQEELRQVLQTQVGRAIIYRLMRECGTYHSVFDTNALVMAFNEGRRHVGLTLLEEVLTDHNNAYIMMQHEANEKDK